MHWVWWEETAVVNPSGWSIPSAELMAVKVHLNSQCPSRQGGLTQTWREKKLPRGLGIIPSQLPCPWSWLKMPKDSIQSHQVRRAARKWMWTQPQSGLSQSSANDLIITPWVRAEFPQNCSVSHTVPFCSVVYSYGCRFAASFEMIYCFALDLI